MESVYIFKPSIKIRGCRNLLIRVPRKEFGSGSWFQIDSGTQLILKVAFSYLGESQYIPESLEGELTVSVQNVNWISKDNALPKPRLVPMQSKRLRGE
jgi:hypothetical protein